VSLALAIAGGLPEGVHRAKLETAVTVASEAVNQPSPEGVINLKLVDDDEIQALNRNYSGIDKVTDVLSFNYTEDGAGPVGGELGDIAISTQTAERQAKAAGTPLETEVTLLLIHGCLHILGYDHGNQGELKRMDQLQVQIMARLNLTYRNFAWDSSTA